MDDERIAEQDTGAVRERLQDLHRLIVNEGTSGAKKVLSVLRADADASVRQAALNHLFGRSDQLAVQAVLTAMDDEDPAVRGPAEKMLRQVTRELLRECLFDLPWSLAARAATELAEREDLASEPVIEELLSCDPPDAAARNALGAALDRIRGRKSRDAAVRAALSPSATQDASKPGRAGSKKSTVVAPSGGPDSRQAPAPREAPTPEAVPTGPEPLPEKLQWSQLRPQLERLASGSPDQRLEAVNQIVERATARGDLRTAEAREAVERLWRVDDPFGMLAFRVMCLNSAGSLGRTPPPASAPERPTDDDLDSARRRWHQGPAPDEFVRGASQNATALAAAVAVLGESAHPSALDTLIPILRQNPSPTVVWSAAGAVGSQAVLEHNQPVSRLRARAGESGRLDAAALRQVGQGQFPDAIGALGHVLNRESPGRQLTLRTQDDDWGYARIACAQELAKLCQPGVDELRRTLLAGKTWSSRVAAARALTTADEPGLTLLLELAQVDEPVAQALAVWSLARRPEREAREAVRSALGGKQPTARQLAAVALERARDRSLAGFTHDRDYVVRYCSVRRAVHQATEVQALVEALDDPHPMVRLAAAPALALVRAPGRHLASWERSGHEALRVKALALNEVLTGKVAPIALIASALSEDCSLAKRALATHALGRAGRSESTILPLLRLLYDPEPVIRHAAIQGLDALHSAAARRPLQELADVDPLPWLREKALRAAQRCAPTP